MYDILKIFGFFTPPPCPHLDLIYTIEFKQPPILCLLFHNPLPFRCGHQIWVLPLYVVSGFIQSSIRRLPLSKGEKSGRGDPRPSSVPPSFLDFCFVVFFLCCVGRKGAIYVNALSSPLSSSGALTKPNHIGSSHIWEEGGRERGRA